MLNQLMTDRKNFLDCFEAFLIDEAHELRKTTLIILAILRNYVKESGHSKKLLVTSATLDTKIFQKYFEGLDLNIIEAKTPTHKVEITYTQFPDLSTNVVENTAAHLRIIFEVYEVLYKHIKMNFPVNQMLPNILVFLPSIKEIKGVMKFIEEDNEKVFQQANSELKFNIEELHGGLKPKEKQSVFNPDHRLKQMVRIILATKIAETAITLDDIFYVLDSGLETEYFFDEVTKMDYHKELPISKSSAIQRKGRAGRIGNGFCFKMYKKEDEDQFEDTSKPEILRMDIADVIMAQIELSDMFLFSDLLFYDILSDNNQKNKIQEVTSELFRIKAIESKSEKLQLTNKGKFMVQMNLKGLTAAFLFECLRLDAKELGIIAATALHNMKGVFRNNVNIY